MKQNLDQYTATTLRVTCGLLAVFSMSCALFMCLFKHRTCHFLSLRFWMEIMSLYQGNELSYAWFTYGLNLLTSSCGICVTVLITFQGNLLCFDLTFFGENGEREKKRSCNCRVLHR